jgi:mercuric ion transport protein
MKKLNLIESVAEKTSSLGALVSIFGCAMCFPAVASLGAALGLGFLSQWEGLFVNTLLPLFAWFALIINLLGWFLHKQWIRTALGILGPIMLLLSLYPLFKYAWSSYVTYTGIALMLLVSLWDIFAPANKHCDDNSCETDNCKVN